MKWLFLSILWGFIFVFFINIVVELNIFKNIFQIAKVSCGGEVSKAVLKEVGDKQILNEYTYEIVTRFGKKYYINGTLYRTNKDFLNSLKLSNTDPNIILTTKDLIKTWNHYMVYFYMDQFPQFLHDAYDTKISYKTEESLRYLTYSLILTHKAFTTIKSENIIDKVMNFDISSNDLGADCEQYLGAVAQILNSPDLSNIVKNYNDLTKLRALSKNNPSLDYILKTLVIREDFTKDVLFDLLNIANVDSKAQVFKNYYSYNNFLFNEKIEVEKLYIPKNTATKTVDVQEKIRRILQIKHEIIETEDISETSISFLKKESK